MKPTMAIFVDSLGHDFVRDEGLFQWVGQLRRVIPTYGYSANQKPQLILGKTADDLGFFNIWQCRSCHSQQVSPSLRATTWLRDRFPLVDKIAHILLRKFLGKGSANIPFGFSKQFEPVDLRDYLDWPGTAFPRQTFIRTVAEDLNVPPNDLEAIRVCGEAWRKEPSQSVFLALTELDHLGHVHGVGVAYKRHAKMLDRETQKLWEEFRQFHGNDAVVHVFSDHGMLDVCGTVPIHESIFVEGDLIFPHFIDSTMVRAWLGDGGAEVRKRLSTLPAISLLSDNERSKAGLSRATHASVIGVLDAGLVFRPNFFGVRPPKGMHGYGPSVSQNHACYLGEPSEGNRPYSYGDVYNRLTARPPSKMR